MNQKQVFDRFSQEIRALMKWVRSVWVISNLISAQIFNFLDYQELPHRFATLSNGSWPYHQETDLCRA